ncbi:LysR family transcriptional regulator [Methylocystis sp. JAN1]|uniref:LysR family transcriptional regulator n=1 Tax=Methylocystis sp. JAN1 TaxID=3397211 RepID=UPI003FA2359A
MDKLSAMNIFAKVVAHGGLSEAGRRLGLTRSAVSKAVMELERTLDTRLLDRTTRSIRPTEAGLAYYERCVEILGAVAETEAEVSRLHAEPRGLLRINAPVSFGAAYLAPAVADFMTLYPNVDVQFTVNDRFVDPIEEGFDVTIRIAELADSSLIARKLAFARRALVASPEYLATHGVPGKPEDLVRHRCLVYGHAAAAPKWRLRREGREIAVPVAPRLTSNIGETLRAAALAGQGVAKLPSFLFAEDVAAGRLVTLLPDYPPTELGVYALYAPNRYLAAKTRLLIDHLAERFRGAPEWEQR